MEKGKFGCKITNIQAGSVYMHDLGVRDNYDCTEAMLRNSLFYNFLKANGMQIHNETSTRDIICVEFSYGSRTYKQERKHLETLLKETEENTKIKEDYKNNKINRINELIKFADDNQEKYDRKTAEQLRTKYYNEGLSITYTSKKKTVKPQTIHYRMLYRTAGKAKRGNVMFIREELYDTALNFLRMGIQLPAQDAPIVEIGAYSSLITSTIDITIGDEGRIKIAPEEILILKDVDSTFRTNVLSVETNEIKQCIINELSDYEVRNAMFDGQALIDSSIFPVEGDGYILLRQHFTKCAAFCTHLQKFFREYYGDQYESATITDMFEREVKVSNIKLVSTDNAIKWLKFDVSFDDWAEWIRKGDNYWGIVKTAHASKYGQYQRMSYQMVNALDMKTMQEACQCSVDYIVKLKNDDETFLQFLRDNDNFSNDYEVLLALVKQNPLFMKSDYFKMRKYRIINNYQRSSFSGRIIQNADNLVIVGSPYAMLLHTVGENPLEDPTFQMESDAIQCWTGRFSNDDYLAEFRNPFNSRNNLGHLHNVYHEYFDKYFKLGDLVIAVNMNQTDFQDRNNGSDQDSDSLFVTNQSEIVTHAKYCYINYPTIVNNIPKEKNHYDSSLDSFAEVDNKLAASQLTIGESSNLAQLCLSYTYNFSDRKYYDYVCILSVLAQASIDNAKRTYDVDIGGEIKRIKIDMEVDKHKYPVFWKNIRWNFSSKRINKDLICPMNYLTEIKIPDQKWEKVIPLEEFFVQFPLEHTVKPALRMEKLIEKYSLHYADVLRTANSQEEKREQYFLLRDDFDELIEDLRAITFSKKSAGLFSWLLNRGFALDERTKSDHSTISKIDKNKSLLMKTLYKCNPDLLLKSFSKNPQIEGV